MIIVLTSILHVNIVTVEMLNHAVSHYLQHEVLYECDYSCRTSFIVVKK